MNRAVCATGVILLSLMAIFALNGWVHNLRTKYIAASISDIGRVPAAALVASSLEYKGVVADFMFLNASNFIGRKLQERSEPLPEEWQQFYLMLDRMTELDGQFLDPYVFAEMMLAWQGQRYDQANTLLAKGREKRPYDWRLPYYIGFNHFFFQQNFSEGARFIMQAANISGSPPYLPNLAARLAFYGSRSKTALVFLQQMLNENKQVEINPELKKRLTALQGAAQIEDAADAYMKETSRSAGDIKVLVEAGFLDVLPVDPYGGKWQLHPSGRVDSTSNFVMKKK